MAASNVQIGSFDFALNLNRQLTNTTAAGNQGPPQNVFFSPASILLVMAMCREGAFGPTEAQIRQTLFGQQQQQQQQQANDQQIDQHVQSLLSLLQDQPQNDQQFVLRAADRLYTQKLFDIKSTFKQAMVNKYRSDIEQVDFAGQSEQVRQSINSWVANITNNRIKDLIPPGQLDAQTLLVLVNALYFKARWTKEFKSQLTKKQTFYISQNKQKDVDMMQQTDQFGYLEKEHYQMLRLSYSDKPVSLIVLLPKEKYGLGKLVEKLDGQKLQQDLQNIQSNKVEVKLPKFKIEQAYLLNDALKAIGIEDAFDKFKANFSGITEPTRLYISKVLHKAFVEVNENGTEAAAATAVIMMPLSAALPPPEPPKSFIADHPFLFAIVGEGGADMENEMKKHILFMGQFYGDQ